MQSGEADRATLEPPQRGPADASTGVALATLMDLANVACAMGYASCLMLLLCQLAQQLVHALGGYRESPWLVRALYYEEACCTIPGVILVYVLINFGLRHREGPRGPRRGVESPLLALTSVLYVALLAALAIDAGWAPLAHLVTARGTIGFVHLVVPGLAAALACYVADREILTDGGEESVSMVPLAIAESLILALAVCGHIVFAHYDVMTIVMWPSWPVLLIAHVAIVALGVALGWLELRWLGSWRRTQRLLVCLFTAGAAFMLLAVYLHWSWLLQYCHTDSLWEPFRVVRNVAWLVAVVAVAIRVVVHVRRRRAATTGLETPARRW